jgi:hypothetical protein
MDVYDFASKLKTILARKG